MNPLNRKIKVGVLYGGDSPEREVSQKSGAAVLDGLEIADFRTVPLLVDSLENAKETILSNPVDVVFIALHGDWGEDGRIQKFLEDNGMKFTGSGSKASELGMDKWKSKDVYRKNGIPVPEGIVVTKESLGNSVAFMVNMLEKFERIICKPMHGGSTVGTTIVAHKGDLLGALEESWICESECLVEQFIPGRELTVTVIDQNGRPKAFPIVEIAPTSGFYDYTSKYTSGRSFYTSPAELPEEVTKNVQELAEKAYNATGCKNYARVDFRLSPQNVPYILELNTAPGMTGLSLVPMAAKALGYSFPELLEMLVKNSL